MSEMEHPSPVLEYGLSIIHSIIITTVLHYILKIKNHRREKVVSYVSEPGPELGSKDPNNNGIRISRTQTWSTDSVLQFVNQCIASSFIMTPSNKNDRHY